ncbi:hypothetical protein SAMN03080615_00856 [Amphritea atlantica]|uniref:Uncharacterized protein n=1 Tax=Amphritea atlantica TaxID=355243 RepID=A0A1H9EER8_9GAMM|nr:hypothetical protein [Amphritea atlantica]SEQ24057.1 hypothetical protein SAMN03080615_00856 [Amphritea atlantica]
MNYLIINLPATYERQQLTFWGKPGKSDTTDHKDALVIEEEYININPERYDNGTTTSVILKEAVELHQGDWRELLNWENPNFMKKGEVA